MKRLGLLIAIWVVFSGCAKHYYHQHTDMATLYLKVPNAENVQFAYSLDAFKLHQAKKVRDRIWLDVGIYTFKVRKQIWEVSVPVNAEFRYFYIVDGSIHLPDCMYRERDDFGSENCLFQPEL